MGVVGKDTIMEMSGKFFEVADLGFGRCKFALAGKKGVELAPLLDLADAIVDIVETGTTLKENGLEVFEDVAPISARLIVNTVSLKIRQQEIEELIKSIEENL